MIGKIVKYAACGAFALTLTCGTLFAQAVNHVAPSGVNTPSEPQPPATVKLFSNLGPTPTNNYNATSGFFVLGSANTITPAVPEQWIAIPFTATKASHATIVSTAIGVNTAGTDGHFNLCIYSDNAGVVGTPLTGCPTTANANATNTFGTCCALTTVHFSGTGLALTAKTQYWVVATAVDTTNAALTATWGASNLFNLGANVAVGGWFTFSANIPAVSVSGTIP